MCNLRCYIIDFTMNFLPIFHKFETLNHSLLSHDWKVHKEELYNKCFLKHLRFYIYVLLYRFFICFNEGNDFFYRFLSNMSVAFLGFHFSISSSVIRFFHCSYSFTDMISVSDTCTLEYSLIHL